MKLAIWEVKWLLHLLDRGDCFILNMGSDLLEFVGEVLNRGPHNRGLTISFRQENVSPTVLYNPALHIAIAIIGNQSVNLFSFLFADMWYQIFLWCLATSVFIHCVSAGVAFFALRQHSRGMFFPLLVIFIGFLYPVTGGIITSEFNL